MSKFNKHHPTNLRICHSHICHLQQICGLVMSKKSPRNDWTIGHPIPGREPRPRNPKLGPGPSHLGSPAAVAWVAHLVPAFGDLMGDLWELISIRMQGSYIIHGDSECYLLIFTSGSWMFLDVPGKSPLTREPPLHLELVLGTWEILSKLEMGKDQWLHLRVKLGYRP